MKEYFTKSKKQELVEEQKNSRLSTSEWCKVNKIPVSKQRTFGFFLHFYFILYT